MTLGVPELFSLYMAFVSLGLDNLRKLCNILRGEVQQLEEEGATERALVFADTLATEAEWVFNERWTRATAAERESLSAWESPQRQSQ